MLKQQKLALALVLVFVFTAVVGPAYGSIYDTMNGELQDIRNNNKYSSDLVNQTVIDLTYISNGSVSTSTYVGENQTLTEHEFSVTEQTYGSAMNKLTRFNFEMHNQYYPENLIGMTGYGALEPDTVYFYVYGPDKDQLIWALTDGISDSLSCTINTSSGGNGNGSWFDKYKPENIDETISTSTFVIGGTELITLTTNESGSTATTTIQMDVAPEVTNERTFLPVRYVANSLGVPDTNIAWDKETKMATITKEDTVLTMSIADNTLLVDNKIQEMDVSPYIKEGRTMLPARWVAEPLGAIVKWDKTTQKITIKLTQIGQGH